MRPMSKLKYSVYQFAVFITNQILNVILSENDASVELFNKLNILFLITTNPNVGVESQLCIFNFYTNIIVILSNCLNSIQTNLVCTDSNWYTHVYCTIYFNSPWHFNRNILIQAKWMWMYHFLVIEKRNKADSRKMET